MTTYFSQKLTCAHCGRKSAHQILGSTNTMGAPDLDLRPAEMKRSTMHAWIQQCPHCSYIANDISIAEGDLSLIGSAQYNDLLKQTEYPELANQFLAHASLLLENTPKDAGMARLHAAWVCDDSSCGHDLAIKCRLLAAECFTRLKPFTDDPESLTVGILLVDILRRAGQMNDAKNLCNELLAKDSVQDFLHTVLTFLSNCIDANDTSVHRIDECSQPE